MTLYLNQLSPWERKDEYIRHIQLGKDVKSQTTILHNAIRDQTLSQLSSASAIIASQDRISGGIGELSLGIDRVEQGIEGLQAAFEWGISEVVWQIEQNREVLKSILEVLMTPLDTQSKERRKRAENAYSNGWINDAEEEFLESEKLNRYDFAIHISLGMIYLFHKIDKNKALKYFDKAIKYATPESKYYTSYALLYKSLVKRDLGLISEAELCTAEAIKLSPQFAEGFFQNSIYNALENNSKAAISSLKRAMELDYTYCLKADQKEEFDNIRDSVTDFLERYLDNEKNIAISNLNKLDNKLNLIDELLSKVDNIMGNNSFSTEFNTDYYKNQLHKTNELIARNSIFDMRNANILMIDVKSRIDGFIQNVNEKYKALHQNERSTVYNFKHDIKHNIDERNAIIKLIPAALFLTIIWGAIPAIIVGAMANNILAAIGVFCAIFCWCMYKRYSNAIFHELPHDIASRIKSHTLKEKKLLSLQDCLARLYTNKSERNAK